MLWASLGAGAVLAVLIAVFASSQPASQVVANSPLLGTSTRNLGGRAGRGPLFTCAVPSRVGPGQLHGNVVRALPGEMPQLLKFTKQHAKAGDATVLTVVYDPTNVGQLKTYLAARSARWPAVNDPAAYVPLHGVTGLPVVFSGCPGRHRVRLHAWWNYGG